MSHLLNGPNVLLKDWNATYRDIFDFSFSGKTENILGQVPNHTGKTHNKAGEMSMEMGEGVEFTFKLQLPSAQHVKYFGLFIYKLNKLSITNFNLKSHIMYKSVQY